MKVHNSNRNKDKTGLCFLLLCAVSLVCSCSREDDLSVDGNPVDAAFAGSFVREGWGDAERAGTRVSDGKWTNGDAVGVYMLPSPSYDLTGAMWKNRKQVIDSNNKMTPDGIANKLYYPLNGDEVRFVAYYPYTASASETAILNKVSFDFADQSTKEKKEAKDFMFHRGTEDYSKAKPNASLGFHHKFSKIWITVNRGSGGPSVKDVAVTLGKMPASATVDLDRLSQQSGDITVGTQAATITAATLSSTTETATVEAIVAPHTGTGNFAGRTFTFNAGGETKIYELPDDVTFSSGYAYHFTFALRETCTITYKANGGSGDDIVRTMFTNDAYSLESNTFTAPSGIPFDGWNTQADGLGTDYAAGQSITPTANMTLYAQWAGVINLATTTAPTGVSYASNTFTINSNGNYRVINSTTANRIVVKSGLTDVTVTLSSASIDVSGTAGACAFDMAGATVTLVLEGTNTLKSGTNVAGLRVPSGANLTIASSTGGTLTASGGEANNSGSGAGIGGNGSGSGAGEAGGTVTINGGTVTAIGGKASRAGGGAGIGGGGGGAGLSNGSAGYAGGAGGSVTITGGTVTATGGGGSNAGGGGAGIGGGAGGDGYGATGVKGGAGGAGGTVTITAGTVTATGGIGVNASGGGAGIGGGGAGDDIASGGAAATYSVSGSATVKATGGTGENAGANIGAGGNS